MTQSFVCEPSPSVVPPPFNRIPYCSPEHRNSDTLDILASYDPEAVASAPDFLNHLGATYDADKTGYEPPSAIKDTSEHEMLDLRNPAHVLGMTSHTLIHSVAGFLDSGVSNTHCIPYWDREAVVAGLEYQDLEHATARLETIDVLSMNALRSYCCYLDERASDHKNRIGLIEHALSMGQRSTQSMENLHAARLEINKGEFNMYAELYAAKLKHLLWIVDRQLNPEIRRYMRPELIDYVAQAAKLDITPDQLTLDMGVDTGMSADSSRPPYDISIFLQLKYRFEPGKEKIYTIPQDQCHRIGVTTLLASIDRPNHVPPFYEDDRYQLPLKFDV